MKRRDHLRMLFTASLLLLDACALMLAFQFAYWTRFQWSFFLTHIPALKGIPERILYEQTLWALLPVWLLVYFYMGLYRETLVGAYDELIQVIKGVIMCALLTTAMSFSLRGVEYSRLVIGIWALYSIVFTFTLRELHKGLMRQLTERVAGPKHVLVVGKGKTMEAIHEMAALQPFIRATFLEALPEEPLLESLVINKNISEILCLQGTVSSAVILNTTRFCEQREIECQIIPDLLELRRGEIILNGFCGLPTFQLKSLSLHGTNYFLKRSFDVILSIMILIALGLPLALISLLIWLDSGYPILYSQDRVGLRGRNFEVFKFRTMITNADAHMEKLKHLSDRPGPVFKMKNDPRVTRVGKLLRRFSIDEIPQIFNVLKGDMSLVGPRPQVLWEAAHYDETAKKRLRVMPGITGLWQVSGRAALSYEEMINLDIYYLENWSLGLDLKILLRTVPAIFAREGAY